MICSRNSAPLSPVVSKASSGALELITIRNCKNLISFLEKSKSGGWKIYGTNLDGPAIELPTTNEIATLPSIVVFGNEGTGLRTNIKQVCDEMLRIRPLYSDPKTPVDCLNIGVAVGVILSHLRKSNQ
eukprot:TRINITY_DN1064_c0_g1_i2.p1 TRINITY_DN1064_c0_g1~~TRINITY_DN1064_c0_g1_i2.p1  ORF type:complete len:128 (-),score=14.83 TRINITY_DN1064_c0_g1_i2:48-431(-)